MAQKLFFVFLDSPHIITADRNHNNRMTLLKEDTKSFSIFSDLKSADLYASEISTLNPGIDVYVIQQTHGYFTPTSPKPQKKVWKEGYYIPYEKGSEL